MEDSQIVKLFLERSGFAIQTLSVKYGNLCNRIAFSILRNHEDADECENDTYLHTWNAIPPFIPNCLKAYVCKISRNIAINKYTYNNRERRNPRAIVLFSELDECLPSSSNVEADSDTTIADAISDFLMTLDEPTRTLFVRRYFELETAEKLAVIYNMKPSTVSTRLLRVRAKLKKYLEKQGITV